MNRRGWISLAVLVGGFWLTSSGQAQAPAPPPQGTAGRQGHDRFVAVLKPLGTSKVSGTLTFTPEEASVRVKGQIEGLTPGAHGFHVHENGDCSAPDGSSAGGHFNPFGAPHAAPDAGQRHVGDLGNVSADASGKATVDFKDTRMALAGEASIVGRAVVVHEKRDDLTSQPAGDAGGRVACGVIQAAPGR